MVNWKLFFCVTFIFLMILFGLFASKVVMVRLLFPIVLLFVLLYMGYLISVAFIEPKCPACQLEEEKKEELKEKKNEN